MKHWLGWMTLPAMAWATAVAAGEVTSTFVTGSDDHFARPHDLVLSADGRYLYVADVGNDRIRVLDPDTLAALGDIGSGEIAAPHDVAFDDRGRLLVADTNNHRIAVYQVDGAAGTLVESWREGLSKPEGVAPGADGRVYVTNASGHDVVVFRDGERIAGAGSRGTGGGEYDRPHDIEVGGDGRVYVADPGNDRLQILDADLNPVGVLDAATYGFNEPKYFATGPDTWLYIADEYNHQLKILDADRALVHVIGSGERGEGPGLFSQPEGMELVGDRLWVSDTRNNRIVLYRLSGIPGAE